MTPAQECLKAVMDMNHLLYGTRPFSQEEEQALASAPNEPMADAELDVMLGELHREYLRKQRHSDVLSEERTEAHSYPQKSNE